MELIFKLARMALEIMILILWIKVAIVFQNVYLIFWSILFMVLLSPSIRDSEDKEEEEKW